MILKKQRNGGSAEEIERQGDVANQLPTTQEEMEMLRWRCFRKWERMVGIRVQTRHIRKQMMEIRGMLSREGVTIIEEMDGLVGGERMGLKE